MKKVLLILLIVSTGFISRSQNYIDLLKLHYSQTPQNEFDSIDGKTNIQELGLDIFLPIKLNEKNALLSGLFLERIRLKTHPLLKKNTISTINLKIGFNKKHSDKWSGTYLLLPKIASDLKKSSANNFQFGALFLMKYTKKNSLKYNFGMYYNKELFGPFFVPLIGLYYKSPSKKFEVNATLPIWADANYQLNNWLKIGSNFSAIVRSYNISEHNTYLVRKTNEIYTYLQFQLKKSILLQTKVGYTIGREYLLYNENDKADLGISAFRFGDNRTALNPTFNDGLVYKIRLLYRFHID